MSDLILDSNISNGGTILKSLLENPHLFLAPEVVESSNDEKKTKDAKLASTNPRPHSAFLGPQLWDKTLPSNIPFENDEDLKFEYMDLDEFLLENGIPTLTKDCIDDDLVQIADTPSPLPFADISPVPSPVKEDNPTPSISPVTVPSVEFKVSEEEIALATVPGKNFDPRRSIFSEDELKPQPMVKKSRKIYVAEECKDDKYWNRRRKNNVAAKRSRDARRVKENQIALRAGYLEKESAKFQSEIIRLKRENQSLRDRLAKYESI